MEEDTILNERYCLLNRIGAGGMSVVHRAQDLALGRLVAVKILHDSLTGDESFLQRFRREAHAAASLSHPNVVTVHDVGQDGNLYYIVMELVDGDDLKAIIRSRAPLPLDYSLNLAIQICQGIGYAHRAGFIHCDVKPQNVIITRDDRAMVADFGISRVISEATMSGEEIAWGTPHYFSPEQAAGKKATPASDVYAIGVILFEMLTGQLPFKAENSTALALKHLNEKPPLVTEINPQLPLPIAKIVNKVLAKEPSARYRTAEQFGRILEGFRTESAQSTAALAPLPSDSMIPAGEQSPEKTFQSITDTPILDIVEVEEDPVLDWPAVFLGAIALLAILGLIPLWIFVYRAYTDLPGVLPILIFSFLSFFGTI